MTPRLDVWPPLTPLRLRRRRPEQELPWPLNLSGCWLLDRAREGIALGLKHHWPPPWR